MAKKRETRRKVKALPAKKVSARKSANVRGGVSVLTIRHDTAKNSISNVR